MKNLYSDPVSNLFFNEDAATAACWKEFNDNVVGFGDGSFVDIKPFSVFYPKHLSKRNLFFSELIFLFHMQSEIYFEMKPFQNASTGRQCNHRIRL